MRKTRYGVVLVCTAVIILTAPGPSYGQLFFPPLPPCLEGPLPETPGGQLSTGTALGSRFELWRIPCDADPDHFITLVRVTPQTAPFPTCPSPARFTCDGCSFPRALIVGDSCSELAEPRTSALVDPGRQCGLFPLPGGCWPPFRPDREAIAIQVEGVTVVSLPAVPDPAPAPTLTIVSTGCRPCRAGQLLNAFTVVHNPTSDLIIAEYRASVVNPFLDEGPIDCASDLYSLPPGDTALPLTGRWSVPSEIPAGSYVFEARLLDLEGGRTLAVERFRVEKTQ